MTQDLGKVTLKSGEQVSMIAVEGPDEDWRDRICGLLSHKGPLWNWQNREVLSEKLGIRVTFHLLHRQGKPFANVLNATLDGVGILGHVFTREEDRRKGAIKRLLSTQMDRFKGEGGQALFLGTGFDSAAYHIYESFGFQSVEPMSGKMAFYVESKASFEDAYFAKGDAAVEDLAWRHWPMSAALFMGDFPCLVRFVSVRLLGRESSEGPLLRLLQEEQERMARDERPRVKALRQERTQALVGLAGWGDHPLWPRAALVDIYCHPAFWDRGKELLQALRLPEDRLLIAYAGPACTAKTEALSALGFQRAGLLEKRLRRNPSQGLSLDVAVWERMP